MNRRKFLVATAASAIGITSVGTAEAAMGARIDKTLRLVPYGVDVTGTISHWDADEVSAVIDVRIVQGSQSARGRTGVVKHGATTWEAFATPRLKPGSAVGHAVALITNQDGSFETYKWTVPVTLV